ncbi:MULTISPECIES: SelB domain-containing protein [unclassified Streptomyces]|uniref:SelB domain-containing protein n=1 Tax=unclassified Streptomyces TaxID=2593676 RepID=UPI0008238FB2|nr:MULTISPECIES: SelB C-terminal domain-containing protein [unclassified Streptomyces]SCK07884.1 selenocysteine-specific elongation factor [Streptomyces sp. AmelKG-E11A]
MVVVTAGHVDHGKSTLLRALTGTDPDRTEEERRRGLTIDLGFVWTSVPTTGDDPDGNGRDGDAPDRDDRHGDLRNKGHRRDGVGDGDHRRGDLGKKDHRRTAGQLGPRPDSVTADAVTADIGAEGIGHGDLKDGERRDERVAFVDVPGHERFLATMLAGAGPAPPVLFTVAADGGWMPQSQEHALALDALGVRDGILVMTRCDLADPGPARDRARAALSGTGLARLPSVAVSARTGDGLPELVHALAALRDRMPPPRPRAPVRLWADRAFTLPGHGLVVTGTLQEGTLTKGDVLDAGPGRARLTVRGLQELGRTVRASTGPARVAVNLRGDPPREGLRGTALCPPGTSLHSAVADVRLGGPLLGRATAEVTVHIGSAAVPARVRRFGRGTARLTLTRPLPLRVGDRAVLTAHRRVVGSAVVLDPVPPYVGPRRAGGARAVALAGHPGTPDPEHEIASRGFVRLDTLRGIGVDIAATAPVAGGWLVSPAERRRIAGEVSAATADGEPVDATALGARLGLPDGVPLGALLPPALVLRAGRVVRTDGAGPLSAAARDLVQSLEAGLAEGSFGAPTPAQLTALGVGGHDLALAVRSGRLVRLSGTVHVAARVPQAAARALAPLAARPFTVSEARRIWNVPRRIALPLIEYLDRAGVTRRGTDDLRTLCGAREDGTWTTSG